MGLWLSRMATKKTFNLAVLFDAIGVMNVKLCTMVLIISLHLFIPLSATLTRFQDHSSFEQFQQGILCYYSINHFSNLHIYIYKGNNWHVSWFDTNFNISFFLDTISVRSLSEISQTLLMVTLFGGLPTHAKFDDLDLLLRWRCVRKIHCKLCFFNSCPV